MRYQRVKNVAWRRVGAETVIINLGRRRMLGVNEAGATVWEELARGSVVLPGEAASFLLDLEAEGVVERLAADEGGGPVALSAGPTPAVVWREDLHHFGACSFMPGQGDLCSGGGANLS